MSKLIAIVGPTASGKSALAMELAQKYNGEIICADSRTIYRYMDIGTAKPTQAEMMLIKHHLVSIKDPGEPFSAAEFKELALEAIGDITGRGKLPLLVGGTGLYVDSVLYDYKFNKEADTQLRNELNKLSLSQLAERLHSIDPALAEAVDTKNPRRVIRAIETAGQSSVRSKRLRKNTLVLGMLVDKKLLQNKITARVTDMLAQGFLDEVRRLGEKFGFDSEVLTGIGYRAFKDVIAGTKTLNEAAAEFVRGDINLAKRQMTWFKRNKDIRWVENSKQADAAVHDFLSV